MRLCILGMFSSLRDTRSVSASQVFFTNGSDSMKKIRQRLKNLGPKNMNAKIVEGNEPIL